MSPLRTLPISLDALARLTLQRGRRREELASVIAETIFRHHAAETPPAVAKAAIACLASIAAHQYLDECRLQVTPERLANVKAWLLTMAERTATEIEDLDEHAGG